MVKCKYVHIHIGKKWREVHKHMGFPDSSGGKESACSVGDSYSIPGSGRSSREWQPTPVFLPEKSHGQRSLAGCMGWQRLGQD
jgi:hypothetical protein